MPAFRCAHCAQHIQIHDLTSPGDKNGLLQYRQHLSGSGSQSMIYSGDCKLSNMTQGFLPDGIAG